MRKLVSIVISFFILACNMEKSANAIQNDPLRKFVAAFIDKEPMTFEDVVLKVGIIDEWDGEILDKKCITADTDFGRATFVFGVSSASEKTNCIITLPVDNSMAWEDIKSKQVTRIVFSAHEDYASFILQDGQYKLLHNPETDKPSSPE